LSLILIEQTGSASRVGACREECVLATHSKGGGLRAGPPRGLRIKSQRPTRCQTQKPPLRTLTDAQQSTAARQRSPRAALGASIPRGGPPATRGITTTPASKSRKRHILRGITPISVYTPGKLDHLQSPQPASRARVSDCCPRRVWTRSSLLPPAHRVTGAHPRSRTGRAKMPRCTDCSFFLFFSRCSAPPPVT